MEGRKENEGERVSGEANNSSVLFAVLRADIVHLLDFIERLNNDEDLDAFEMDRIEKLKFELTYIWTYAQLSCANLAGFTIKMSRISYMVQNLVYWLTYPCGDDMVRKYNRDSVFPRLEKNMLSYIRSQRDSITNATMAEEQLVELLDSLLMNLHDLSKYCAELISPSMIQYEILQKLYHNIRDFHGLKVSGFIKHEIVECILPQFQLVAERVGHFCLILLVTQLGYDFDELDDPDLATLLGYDFEETNCIDEILDVSRVNLKLTHLLVKIIPVEQEVIRICSTNLRASDSAEVELFVNQLLEATPDILRQYLFHLQEYMVNVVIARTSAGNIHVMIEFLLIILTDMPKDLIHHDKLLDLLARVGALTREVSILVSELEEKSRNEESTNATLDLLENTELLKRDLKHIFLKAPVDSSQLCFPMSDGPLFMHLLLINLNELLNSNDYSVALIKEDIRLVRIDLEFIKSFMGNVERELYKDLWTRVLDVAYVAEDSIKSILVRSDHCLLQLIFLLPETTEKIKLIKEEVFNLPKKICDNRSFVIVNSPNKPVKKKSSATGHIIVGFEEETNLIIRKLTHGQDEIDVISIIGMPGLGKTTLAYRVYNDKSIAGHFDVRAWCTVDQERNEKKLLQNIYNQVTGSNDKLDEDTDVADELRRKLYGRRYLIVLDDLWDAATWDALTRPFPDVKKGSRIMVTSRKKDVALHGKRRSDPLYLRLFRVEESWELLEKRVFGEDSCPDELLDVGKEIAQNCQGLPLVADLISGVIARKEKKRISWLEVLNNLDSFIFKNEVDVMNVIQLSYDHLPDCLKPCLLYLASYPKDEQIQVMDLKEFWTAEGFVEQTELKSVEEVLEVYLDGLISSSLVMAFQWLGTMTTCQIHDLVHDFCSIKAREEKLFGFISSSDPSSADLLMPRQMIISLDQQFCNSHDTYDLFKSEKKRDSGKHLASVKVDAKDWKINHLRHLRLIRVLRLGEIVLKDTLLNEIGCLVHLRYLEIKTGKVNTFPLSWSNLWNLETLVVFSRESRMVLLPTIWNLVRLRRVSMFGCTLLGGRIDEPIVLAKDSKLEHLRILAWVDLHYLKDIEEIFKRFPRLQSFKCSIFQSREKCNWFPKLDVLDTLEELYAIVYSAYTNSGDFPVGELLFHLPWSLKKLRLGLIGPTLTSDSLSTISSLPNLQELVLMHTTIQGKEWRMGEDDNFKNLKYLELRDVRLSEWLVGEESFPVLEELHLEYCMELREIPSSFGDIETLKAISMECCPPRLGDSALQIKEYVTEMMGQDKLQVRIDQ